MQPDDFDFWKEDELARLDALLQRESLRKFDPSMLDGLICALVSGPSTLGPTELMEWIRESEDPSSSSPVRIGTEADELAGLVMRQWNAIEGALTQAPRKYEPLLPRKQVDGRVVTEIARWCAGYVQGMDFDFDEWSPLSFARPDLMATILVHGSEEGQEKLKREPMSPAKHEKLAAGLAGVARDIHAFWLAQRTPAQPVRRASPKVGRNDPCPCGSGRKYKHCHGAG